MDIDAQKLDAFMDVVLEAAYHNDFEMNQLAAPVAKAIFQYDVEVRRGLPSPLTPAQWIEGRKQFGWPQQLEQLREAYEQRQAIKEAQGSKDGELTEALAELKKLRKEIAELRESKPAPAEEKPVEEAEKPEAAAEEDQDEEETEEEA